MELFRFGVHTLKQLGKVARLETWDYYFHFCSFVQATQRVNSEQAAGNKRIPGLFDMVGIPVKSHWSCSANWRLT